MTGPRRILLLDLFAHVDGFLGDTSMQRLATALTADGHAVHHLRGVADDAGLETARAAVASHRPEIVVMDRIWTIDLVELVRGQTEAGTRLIKLSRTGTTSALDGSVDAVLDARGVQRLAAGEAVEPVTWQPIDARTIREARRLQVVAAAPEPAVAGPEGRPTISGPAGGCPYLRDSRTTDPFRGLELDPTKVQTRGCTFCLDNVGAYATASETETVASWIEQWGRIRNASPDAREVLLTDERPHPYLPAFFRAVEERGLGPVELMIKSRVDWLLEYADGPISEAATIARRSGSILHVYLIGFESFDPSHLELFNKGHTVEDSIRAIERARSLATEFPDSFEFRKYRAHGIVLFTPWTEPEALLENARVMRQVRFEEFRSECVRTRLRLYPRTPLYHLARRDGLLTAEFDDARPDRAAEQGYDASYSWRFRNPLTEAIYHAATELSRARRSMLDADVLEVAVRFVLRWPTLARAPAAAGAALLQTVGNGARSRGALQAGEAGILAFDRELELLRAGSKRAALKESVPTRSVEDQVAAYAHMGLVAGPVSSHDEDRATGQHAEGNRLSILAITRDAEDLRQVVDAQREVERGGSSPVERMGILMGYPPCCARAFAGLEERGDNLANERAPFRRAPDAPLHPLLNRLGQARLISHHLCRPDCEASVAQARHALDLLGEVDPHAPARMEAILSTPVLFLNYDRRLELVGTMEGDVFQVASAASIGNDWPRDVPLEGLERIEVGSRRVTLSYQDGQTRALDAEAPLLIVPGEPLPAGLAASLVSHPLTTLAPVPVRFRSGERIGSALILRVSTTHEQHTILVQIGNERVALRLRPRHAGNDRSLRIGEWVVGVGTRGPLSGQAGEAVDLLLEALRAGEASPVLGS